MISKSVCRYLVTLGHHGSRLVDLLHVKIFNRLHQQDLNTTKEMQYKTTFTDINIVVVWQSIRILEIDQFLKNLCKQTKRGDLCVIGTITFG